VSATDYSLAFYDAIRPGCQQSAAVVAPLIYELVTPSTVIDVGCGEGWWAKAFEGLGATVTGIDGVYVSPVVDFTPADLTQPLPPGQYDLAVCLEVAEHLPESHAGRFVADLCGLAPVVLFSAAIPGQTGAGHINCQWPTWWAAHFARHGYGLDGSLRLDIWDDARIEPWYRQNLMVASRGDARPLDLVHPDIYGWK
jgi:SAM-dependent methyltransferase